MSHFHFYLVVLANFIEQQKTQASEAIALIHHWQKAAIEANDENELLRKSIEKAGENIRILRRMLEEEKKKAHRLQETLDKSSALPNSGGVSAHSFNQSKILTAQNSSESIKNEPREGNIISNHFLFFVVYIIPVAYAVLRRYFDASESDCISAAKDQWAAEHEPLSRCECHEGQLWQIAGTVSFRYFHSSFLLLLLVYLKDVLSQCL